MQKYPKPKLMKLNAWDMIACWSALILWGLFTLLAWRSSQFSTVAKLFFYIFISTAIVHIFLATFLTCPTCGKRPTVQVFKIHENSEKMWGMDGWAVVIIRSAFHGRFRCIHCATDYEV